MARRRYRRYRRRRAKWSSNIQRFRDTRITEATLPFNEFIELATCPAQSNSLVSQIYTFKNVEVTMQIEVPTTTGFSVIEGLTAYVMYLPEKFDPYYDLPKDHPEWIMAYRYLGSPEQEVAGATGIRNPLRFKTRLARKMNTGDRIILLIQGINTGTATQAIDVDGLVRWWTKAN